MAESGEDSDLELSSSTLAALNEFRQEEAVRQQVQEDLLSGKAAIQVFSLLSIVQALTFIHFENEILLDDYVCLSAGLSGMES